MKLTEIYKNKNVISFEVFPHEGLPEELQRLKELNPAFISLTQTGGGGCDVRLLDRIKNGLGMDVMAHLLCRSAESIDEINALGIENILALRGDTVDETSPYRHASDLVTLIKSKTRMDIGVAGYPEGHIDAPDLLTDIENLKKKVDAGASAIFTQLFFDNAVFYRFYEMALAKGITLPVLAGIMPMYSRSQVEKMIFMCAASLPSAMIKLLNKYKDSPADMLKAGVEYASRQIADLLAQGVDGVHFYAMNKPDIARMMAENIYADR